MRLTTSLLLVAFASQAWAEQAAVEIPFAPPTGSSWAIEETLTKTRTDGNGTQTSTARLESTFVIQRATPSGFEATWTTDAIEAEGQRFTAQNAPPMLFMGFPFRLTLDHNGMPTGIVDWPATRTQLFEALEPLMSDRAARDATRRLMESWDSELAAQITFKALTAISVCEGVALPSGQALEADGEVPNGLGGPPILAKERLELISVDRGAGVAHIRYTRSLDPRSAAESMRVALERMANETNRPMQEVAAQFAGGRMVQENNVTCEVDLATGVVRAATVDAMAEIGTSRQRERREILIRRN